MSRAIITSFAVVFVLACGDDATTLDGGSEVDAARDVASSDDDAGALDVGAADGAIADASVADAAVDVFDSSVAEVVKAFPGAYGGGANATGARGDDNAVLVIVDTLDYDAPLRYDAEFDVYEGGIKAAFEDEVDGRGRYITFAVSGVIEGGLPFTTDGSNIPYQSGISGDREENVTVFGQSAPRGGITLHRSYIHFIRSNNVIVRYLTVRTGLIQGSPVGDDRTTVPLNIGASNAIIDHCSASWGGDKGVIIGDWRAGFPLYDTTVQNTLIADSATLAFSVNGGGEAEDFAAGGNVTWHYNFIAGQNRTPNMGGFNGLGVIQNNIVDSSGTKLSTIVYGAPRINHLSNYYRIRRSSGTTLNQFQDVAGTSPLFYTAGNYLEDDNGVQLSGAAGENNQAAWQYFAAGGPLPDSLFVDTPHEATAPGPLLHPAPLLSAAETFEEVLSDVGNNRYLDDEGRVQRYQDDYDTRAIENARADRMEFRKFSSDWVLPAIPEERRPDTYDTDHDGMSDAWEMRMFGNLDQGYRDDADADGYTNIEEYLNQVDAH